MFPRMVEMMVNGIPAKAKVTNYKKHKGNMSRFAQDPEEYWGWVELDYQLCDRKGRRAEWLDDVAERNNLWEDVEAEIIEELDDMTQGEKEHWLEMKQEERRLNKFKGGLRE